MIYPSDFEERIGFDKIRQQVGQLLQTEGATLLLENTRFSNNPNLIKSSTGQTFEMLNVLNMNNDFPLDGFRDINKFLKKISIHGTFLEPSQLVELYAALTLLQDIKSFFIKHREESSYPLLDKLTCGIGDYGYILSEIVRIIDKHGKVKDNASPRLKEIRDSLRDKNQRVSRQLQQILQQAIKDGITDEDGAVTVRDGRSLIPVSASNKRKLKGFIHSESATGRTAFVEPVEVVELNNEIKELQAAESREIVKILTDFTNFLRPNLDELISAGELLYEIDFIIGKARWAQRYDARLPIINTRPSILLRQARHPLLESALKKEGKPLIPLDLQLSKEKHILLISGPNAGGKSVCLKTVGLLQYMFQCGFLITALDNSELGVFDSIFIDIGDQQSIDNDLSTYSSHLLNMKTILQKSTCDSLVLIDEFGGGTEPTTGGAIAESVLQKLVERNAFGVITTHYTNLKYYAAETEGIINGAMTFDLQRIEPLFKLDIGQPGSSFAFEIARKIGLSEEIIQMATEKIGTEHVDIEKQLREAIRDKRYWERKRDSIRRANIAVESAVQEYEKELIKLREERSKIIKEAKDEAQHIVSEANRKIEKTIREIREAEAEKERTRQARSELHDFIESFEKDAEKGNDSIERKIQKLRERESRRQSKLQEAKGDILTDEDSIKDKPKKKIAAKIEVGSNVKLKGQNTIGEVIQLNNNNATVAFGNLTTQVEVNRLEVVSKGEYKQQTRNQTPRRILAKYDESKKRGEFKQQIDLRGMRAAEALELVENFIDKAIMFRFERVSILHGKGTGALKQEIRNYLATHPVVLKAYDEDVRLGGAGITIVELDI